MDPACKEEIIQLIKDTLMLARVVDNRIVFINDLQITKRNSGSELVELVKKDIIMNVLSVIAPKIEKMGRSIQSLDRVINTQLAEPELVDKYRTAVMGHSTGVALSKFSSTMWDYNSPD